jgi:hypothetical protein
MIDDGWVDQFRKKGEEMVGDIFSLDVFFFLFSIKSKRNNFASVQAATRE